jgi:hypothetical protein
MQSYNVKVINIMLLRINKRLYVVANTVTSYSLSVLSISSSTFDALKTVQFPVALLNNPGIIESLSVILMLGTSDALNLQSTG